MEALMAIIATNGVGTSKPPLPQRQQPPLPPQRNPPSYLQPPNVVQNMDQLFVNTSNVFSDSNSDSNSDSKSSSSSSSSSSSMLSSVAAAQLPLNPFVLPQPQSQPLLDFGFSNHNITNNMNINTTINNNNNNNINNLDKITNGYTDFGFGFDFGNSNNNSNTMDGDPNTMPTLPQLNYSMHKKVKSNLWTIHDEKALAVSIQKLSPVAGPITNWKGIALDAFPNFKKNATQCSLKWKTKMDPTVKQGPWSETEDEILIKGLHRLTNGTFDLKLIKWRQISELITGRVGKQCRERWHNQLDPSLKKGPFTPEEDALLIKLTNEIGNKWSQIAKLMPGRSDNALKNRHYSALNTKNRSKSMIPRRKKKSNKSKGKQMKSKSYSNNNVNEWVMPYNGSSNGGGGGGRSSSSSSSSSSSFKKKKLTRSNELQRHLNHGMNKRLRSVPKRKVSIAFENSLRWKNRSNSNYNLPKHPKINNNTMKYNTKQKTKKIIANKKLTKGWRNNTFILSSYGKCLKCQKSNGRFANGTESINNFSLLGSSSSSGNMTWLCVTGDHLNKTINIEEKKKKENKNEVNNKTNDSSATIYDSTATSSSSSLPLPSPSSSSTTTATMAAATLLKSAATTSNEMTTFTSESFSLKGGISLSNEWNYSEMFRTSGSKMNKKQTDKIWISPEGQKFRSMISVNRWLALPAAERNNQIAMDEQRRKKKELKKELAKAMKNSVLVEEPEPIQRSPCVMESVVLNAKTTYGSLANIPWNTTHMNNTSEALTTIVMEQLNVILGQESEFHIQFYDQVSISNDDDVHKESSFQVDDGIGNWRSCELWELKKNIFNPTNNKDYEQHCVLSFNGANVEGLGANYKLSNRSYSSITGKC